MRLLYQTHSPYARKVLVMAHEVGLASRLDVVHYETSPTRRNDLVYALNPLGKVPVLVTEDGFCLFDSIVICEYLEGLHGGERLIPASGIARWQALRLQALAQGLADAGIALRWEIERRPEALRWAELGEGQRAKLLAGYDFLERGAARWPARHRADRAGDDTELARLPRLARLRGGPPEAGAMVRPV